ncbi:Arachidonate 12-lipoxygenase, 12R-type [Holothuria leucospilota]|uniref:Arachidonate 12-lipoxygenase, 12R-type n=1 Tax=Holothuria leucospilota TaxID=206669 RepID=A0A9Q1CPY9_HOLLE|nr:Arachidonate 12-lipoxygenase, 12R-type [Holothuria leucospilota]
MGNNPGKELDFVISVKTGDIFGQGTNNKIEILRMKGIHDDRWFMEVVKVKNRKTGIENVFPVNRWVPSGTRLRIKEFDACLPQFAKDPASREEELQKKRKEYTAAVRIPNWLPQLENVPEQERFTFEYLFDLGQLGVKTTVNSTLSSIMTKDQVVDQNSILQFYDEVFQMPKSVSFWKDDTAFGRQRLNHVNCTQIRLCTKIPDKFVVREESLESGLLEGVPLKDALESKRLYYIDYEILKGIKCAPGRQVCAPLALFFVNSKGQLKPVAIQLFQEPSETNPVFYPTDDFITWQLAKMWFNNADASFHQSSTHLAFTHLIMEAACVAVHRSLSPSHPVFRLLAPHFLYLIAINDAALSSLVNEGGWVNKAMSIGRDGMFDILSRHLAKWRLDVQGSLPADLKDRGVDDINALPGYYYRDDGLRIYYAIHEYVKDVLTGFYEPGPSDGDEQTDGPSQRLVNDSELQEFARCLSASVDDNGVGIPGVHGEGKFQNLAEVTDVCTSFIFIASAGHAAANFGQYDDYGYPPFYPGMLIGTPVSDKRPRNESDITAVMPPKEVIFDTLKITKVLSTRATEQLRSTISV